MIRHKDFIQCDIGQFYMHVRCMYDEGILKGIFLRRLDSSQRFARVCYRQYQFLHGSQICPHSWYTLPEFQGSLFQVAISVCFHNTWQQPRRLYQHVRHANVNANGKFVASRSRYISILYKNKLPFMLWICTNPATAIPTGTTTIYYYYLYH